MSDNDPIERAQALDRLRALARAGRIAEAEAACQRILSQWPGEPLATRWSAQRAAQRGDHALALSLLATLLAQRPDDVEVAMELAMLHLQADCPTDATQILESVLSRAPDHPHVWLLLGEVRENLGHEVGALKAWHQAVTRAQQRRQWVDQDSTPPHLLAAVLHAIEVVRTGRAALWRTAYDDVRAQFGAEALRRVDRAVSAHLDEWQATPASPHQRPRFFYMPDLPAEPYLDPSLQPWAPALLAAFPAIREEALRVFAEDGGFDDFVQLREGGRMRDFVDGTGPSPAWEALFFWRHGQRYDSTHQRCPTTSAVLESIELCRVADEAPEICFSVLKPGTTILPHHGVTNTRSVMHLPLLVPPDCALNVLGAGEHHWREGELMLFDDTFRHEAWNRSAGTRIILLMDCWNPHLTDVEKLAIQQLIETIGGLHRAARAGEGR
jgi:aspartyl/asparaginyl beta-hydroxylase (cupin superfamily)